MEPQLVLAELNTKGYNNGDLDQTRARMDKSKAWKRQRIVVIIPAGTDIPTKVYLSHMNLIFPPNNGVARIAAIGMEVGEAFSSAIENVLSHPELSKWEYILTVEHDNLPPADGVIKLLEHMEDHPEFSCVGGLYYVKGPSAPAQIWGDPLDPVINFRPLPPDPNGGLVECCGTGMGFNLWRMSMFKDKSLRKPFFKTLKGSEGVGTQDLYFWNDARKHGHRCAVACDVKVGHYDKEADFTW